MADTHPAPATPEIDSLNRLRVFDRLEVGPPQLESKRLAASYRLIHDGKAQIRIRSCAAGAKSTSPPKGASPATRTLTRLRPAGSCGIPAGPVSKRAQKLGKS